MAPQVGLEPTTLRLTAECSAIELLRSVVTEQRGRRSSLDYHEAAGILFTHLPHGTSCISSLTRSGTDHSDAPSRPLSALGRLLPSARNPPSAPVRARVFSCAGTRLPSRRSSFARDGCSPFRCAR